MTNKKRITKFIFIFNVLTLLGNMAQDKKSTYKKYLLKDDSKIPKATRYRLEEKNRQTEIINADNVASTCK